MRSRAHFRGHPIHPALIPFPFAFLLGALAFDLFGIVRGSRVLWATSAHLTMAGLATGILAAIPGLIDYVHTVPPRSSAKARATRHAIGNVAALALFALALAFRGAAWAPSAATLGFEVFGAVALGYAGWMGGTLVSRNLISVDHRYAQAGKWQEAVVAGNADEPLVVGHVDDLKENQMKLLLVNGHRIALARTTGGYCAFDDRCPHRGGSLAGGVIIEGVVQCLWHGSQFDASTGLVTCGPAKSPVRVYEVKETRNGQILLAAPNPAKSP